MKKTDSKRSGLISARITRYVRITITTVLAVVTLVLGFVSDTVIIQMQDVLEKDNSARMNLQ